MRWWQPATRAEADHLQGGGDPPPKKIKASLPPLGERVSDKKHRSSLGDSVVLRRDDFVVGVGSALVTHAVNNIDSEEDECAAWVYWCCNDRATNQQRVTAAARAAIAATA